MATAPCAETHCRYQPAGDAFRRANPGFEAVELFPMNDSAWGVMFAAGGKISPNVNLMQLYEFMWSTKPPSSVDVSKVTTDFSGLPRSPVMRKVPALTPDGRRIEINMITEPYPGSDVDTALSSAEPGGRATGSQPIRSETNRTSSAAGSRRRPLRYTKKVTPTVSRCERPERVGKGMEAGESKFPFHCHHPSATAGGFSDP